MNNVLDMIQVDYSNVCIIGDLNFDLMDTKKSETLKQFSCQYDLKQLVEGYTNQNCHGKSLIDVILTSKPSACKKTGNRYTGISDSHNLVYTVMKERAPRLPAKTVVYRNYKHYNEDKFSHDIGLIPHTVCELFDNPSDNYWALQTLLKEVMDDHAPLKKAKVRARDTPFMNKQLRRATRDKARLYRKYRNLPNNRNWERYRKQRNLTTKIRKTAIKDHFMKTCSGGQKNPDFWNTIKPFLTNKGSNNGSNIMIQTENSIETEPEKVANLLNEFYVNIELNLESNSDFVSKCVDFYKDHLSIKNIKDSHVTQHFNFVHTNTSAVEKIIKNLEIRKSTGYDSIPPKLLKPVASQMSVHITKIFNLSVDTCTFPQGAKLAEVVPVFKKDNNLIMKNYRPVSILPSLSKVLEKIMHEQLQSFLDGVLHPRIAAYRRSYSCEHVLLELVETWKLALDSKKYVGAIMMDLSKAFDCLPHPLTLAKLYNYGMTKDSCGLLWSYLSDRHQRVKLTGKVSTWCGLTKGIPQGSILGPVVFNLFVNDLYGSIKAASLHNYADDNTISAIASNKNELIKTLTDESLAAMNWFEANMMEANASKFQAIVLNTKDHIIFNINGAQITSEDQVKLLGVSLDKDLNFHHHVETIIRKAGAKLRVLQRLSKLLDTPSKMQIFHSFILSHFTYCCLVWHFCGSTLANRMERIQYRALKFVYSDHSTDYESLLKRANLPSLELARNRKILINIFKSQKGLTPSFIQDIFKTRIPRYNLRNKNNISYEHCRTVRYGLQTLSHYGAKLWNSLSMSIKDSDSLEEFKTKVNRWEPRPCRCTLCYS